MRADSVVMIAPPAGDAANLLKAVEDLAIEQLIAQTGIDPKGGEANLSI